MNLTNLNKRSSIETLAKRTASLRILFGIVWVVDAVLKFEPAFYRGLLTFVMSKDAGEPGWLNPWFHAWYRIIGLNPTLFAIVIIIVEAFIALSLLFGIARRLNYIIAIPFMFLIWGVGEAFGGPYVAGSTDINAGFIYVIAFLFLYVMDGLTPPKWSLDPLITKRFAWWSVIADPPALAKIASEKKNSK
jgi:thiosulfate dehydrogenase [quinone] large subunit